MKILELQPGRRVVWACVDSSAKDWIGTHISFDLVERAGEGGETVVAFRHSGWLQESDFFANCSYHWALALKSLKDLCDKGKGSPS